MPGTNICVYINVYTKFNATYDPLNWFQDALTDLKNTVTECKRHTLTI